MHFTQAIHNTVFQVVLGYVELCAGNTDTKFQKLQYKDLCTVCINLIAVYMSLLVFKFTFHFPHHLFFEDATKIETNTFPKVLFLPYYSFSHRETGKIWSHSW